MAAVNNCASRACVKKKIHRFGSDLQVQRKSVPPCPVSRRPAPPRPSCLARRRPALKCTAGREQARAYLGAATPTFLSCNTCYSAICSSFSHGTALEMNTECFQAISSHSHHPVSFVTVSGDRERSYDVNANLGATNTRARSNSSFIYGTRGAAHPRLRPPPPPRPCLRCGFIRANFSI